MKFEDLIHDPIPILKELFSFIFDVDSIEGTVLEKRIEEKCGVSDSPKALYKLKPSGTAANRNAHLYSAE